MLFQKNAGRPRLAYSGSLRLQKSVVRGIRYAAHLSEGFLIFYWAQFILSGENYQKESKVNPQTAITEGTAKVAKTKTQGEKL